MAIASVNTESLLVLLHLVGIGVGVAALVFVLTHIGWAIAKGLGKLGTFIIPLLCGIACVFVWRGENCGLDDFFPVVLTGVIIVVGSVWGISCMLFANLFDLDREYASLEKEKEETAE